MKRAIIAAFLLFHACALAQDESLLYKGNSALLSTRQSFTIRVDDRVTDGCLPRPDAIKDAFEIALRKNGFHIDGTEAVENFVDLVIIGSEITAGYCSIALEGTLSHWVLAEIPYASQVPTGNMAIVSHRHRFNLTSLTDAKSLMQERIEEQTAKAADDLYLLISRARDDIFSKFPEIEASFKAYQ